MFTSSKFFPKQSIQVLGRAAISTASKQQQQPALPAPQIRNKAYALAISATISAAVLSAALADNTECGFFGVDIKKVKADIEAAVEADNEKRGDGTSIAPTLIRLAWHSSGTYSIHSGTGGSSGAGMRFSPECDWGANAGLKDTRAFLEKIKNKHGLSYSDTWTLAGVVAVEMMGGPEIKWRSGRKDLPAPDAALPDGRLPNADMGCPASTNAHLRDIFGKMGFSDREIVALSGAHSLGRCHENASGYWGPWTNAETTFSNQYFVLLLQEKWTVKKTHNGKPWKGPMQYENSDGTLMMLPSDLWLLDDKDFRKYVEMYAKDEELFAKDFAAAFGKLLELGVKF
mmetsp:Transcript_13212/g.22000  ORF Transcript_13212/g.22000 Transcript_13212/m.22000 type:complete len:343 (+) Transcript_13212:98-1126(+)